MRIDDEDFNCSLKNDTQAIKSFWFTKASLKLPYKIQLKDLTPQRPRVSYLQKSNLGETREVQTTKLIQQESTSLHFTLNFHSIDELSLVQKKKASFNLHDSSDHLRTRTTSNSHDW